MRIELTGVTVDFADHGLRVLDRVDLSIHDGEQVALLGASGAGKSTLLRVVLGAVAPVAGTVRVAGLDPFGRTADTTRIRRATGLVRQRDDLVRGLSARTNILIGQTHRWRPVDWLAVLSGRVPRRHAGRLAELARRHGVDEFLDTRIEHLSGGQRQRVALMRALLPAPRLLLADESTSGLDPTRAEEALAHLRDADGATLVATTHDLAVARQFPRIIALRDGHIVFDGARGDRPAAGRARDGHADGGRAGAGHRRGPHLPLLPRPPRRRVPPDQTRPAGIPATHQEETMKFLIVLHDPPYGTERTYNGIRWARQLIDTDGNHEVKVFMFADAVAATVESQKTPNGYYNLGKMIKAFTDKGGVVGNCGTCMDARGIADDRLVPGSHRSGMAELADWTLWADKVINI